MASVLVFIADGSEELETVTIVDLLRRAKLEVDLVGLTPHPVRCSRGVVITPDFALEAVDEAKRYDLVVIPGGLPGADHLNANAEVHRILQRQATQKGLIGAICAAPKVLATAGLLENQRATSFPGALNKDSLPNTQLVEDAVVISNTIITSKGPGTAMDFALSLIELLLGSEQRKAVEAPLQRTH